jgi:hypothetical protein
MTRAGAEPALSLSAWFRKTVRRRLNSRYSTRAPKRGHSAHLQAANRGGEQQVDVGHEAHGSVLGGGGQEDDMAGD